MAAQIKITKRTIDHIESDGSDRFYWDRELPGFGLRVRGVRPQVLRDPVPRQRPPPSDDPRTGHSHFPEKARRRAMALLSEAKAGGDPALKRDADRKVATVKGLGERFLDEYVPTPLQAQHSL